LRHSGQLYQTQNHNDQRHLRSIAFSGRELTKNAEFNHAAKDGKTGMKRQFG